MIGGGVGVGWPSDRRREHRVELAVPVQVSQGARRRVGTRAMRSARSVNLSAGGIYLVLSEGAPLSQGETLNISVAIPWEARREVPFSRILGPCYVVRVEALPQTPTTKRQGVALAFCAQQTVMLGTTLSPR